MKYSLNYLKKVILKLRFLGKPILMQLFLLLLCFKIFSQKLTQDFIFGLPEQKIQNSFYKSIKYIDSREDTTNMGVVFKDHGFGDRRTTVILSTPLSIQLSGVLNELVDSTSKDGTILFQLRKFNFVQTSGGTYSKRYCFLRAEIYSMNNGLYQKLAFIDTTIITHGNNSTKKILIVAGTTISNFIATNLTRKAPDSNYFSLIDISKIDSLEKQQIFVYNTSKYTDGLYTTYKSFMNQTPDSRITAQEIDSEISSVKSIDETGNTTNVKAKDVFAIVFNGQPFISTTYGYFKLRKVDDDFIFVGKAKAVANSADVEAAAFAFGIIGGILASNVTEDFEMKIDHVNGEIITLRQIKE